MPQVEAFNNAWWAEICRGSKRDQISLPVVVHKLGLKAKHITGSVRNDNPYFVRVPHER